MWDALTISPYRTCSPFLWRSSAAAACKERGQTHFSLLENLPDPYIGFHITLPQPSSCTHALSLQVEDSESMLASPPDHSQSEHRASCSHTYPLAPMHLQMDGSENMPNSSSDRQPMKRRTLRIQYPLAPMYSHSQVDDSENLPDSSPQPKGVPSRPFEPCGRRFAE